MLRQLHIQENRLDQLPDELGCLKRLEVLNAAGNQLETVKRGRTTKYFDLL
jgi:Leucine-rich repeat (LRR) protein